MVTQTEWDSLSSMDIEFCYELSLFKFQQKTEETTDSIVALIEGENASLLPDSLA